MTLVLEYEPEGLVEKVGDKVGIVANQAQNDLERFKQFIESEGYATGAWRGSVGTDAPVGTPGVEDAAASRGDSGKAGPSGKAVAAGVGAAAAAAAAVVGSKSGSSDSAGAGDSPSEPVTEPAGEVGGTAPGTGGDGTLRMLTDEEIEAGASDVPAGADETAREAGGSR